MFAGRFTIKFFYNMILWGSLKENISYVAKFGVRVARVVRVGLKFISACFGQRYKF